jgi:hypothetical protein
MSKSYCISSLCKSDSKLSPIGKCTYKERGLGCQNRVVKERYLGFELFLQTPPVLITPLADRTPRVDAIAGFLGEAHVRRTLPGSSGDRQRTAGDNAPVVPATLPPICWFVSSNSTSDLRKSAVLEGIRPGFSVWRA